MQKNITLAQGNGGEENRTLIDQIFFKHLGNAILARAEDAAVLALEGKVAMSTDAFTVSPMVFPGGDIGKLSVCGTCNDVAMMGAKPRFMTCSFVIEEGTALREVERMVRSMKQELALNGVAIVSGDTKVVPKGAVDGMFITTTGIGEVIREGISAHALKPGMAVLVSRDIGAHGATIFAEREGIGLKSDLQSDCASLYPTVEALFEAGVSPAAMRDATRGGVSAVLNEWASASETGIVVEEEALPVSDAVRGICEMLGFEAYDLANEGTFVLAVEEAQANTALEVLRSFHATAERIGTVTDAHPKSVVLRSSWGTQRYMEMPTGELLPRIC